MFTNHDSLCRLSHLMYRCPKDLCSRPRSDKYQRKLQVVYILKCHMYIVFQTVDSKISGASKTHYATEWLLNSYRHAPHSFDYWLCTIIRRSYRLHRKTTLGQFILQSCWRIMRFSVSQNLQDLQERSHWMPTKITTIICIARTERMPRHHFRIKVAWAKNIFVITMMTS